MNEQIDRIQLSGVPRPELAEAEFAEAEFAEAEFAEAEFAEPEFAEADVGACEDRVDTMRLSSTRAHPMGGAIDAFRCRGCGDVIGVYEPLVVREQAGAHTTSRAAEPQLRARPGEHYYHRRCYTS
jgi:hypothetical protein